MVMRLLSVRLALVALGACCAPGVSASGLASAWRRWELPSRDFPDYAGSVRAAEAGEEASSAGRAAARAGGAAGGRLRDLYDGAPGAEAPTGGMRAPAPDVSLADGSSVDAYLLRATRAGPAAARGRSGWRAALRAEQVATATALQNLTVPWGGVALAAARFDVPAPQLRPLVVRDAREALRWVPPPSLSAAAAAAQRAHALPARLAAAVAAADLSAALARGQAFAEEAAAAGAGGSPADAAVPAAAWPRVSAAREQAVVRLAAGLAARAGMPAGDAVAALETAPRDGGGRSSSSSSRLRGGRQQGNMRKNSIVG